MKPFIRIASGFKTITLTIQDSEKENLLSRKEQEPLVDYEYDPDFKDIKKGISTQIQCPFCKRYIK